MAELLTKEQVDQAHIVGGSYSGLVAQFFARQHPDKVASLILTNTGVPSLKRARRYERFIKLLSGLPIGLVHRLMRGSIAVFLTNNSPEQRFWRNYFAEIIPQFTRAELINRVRILVDMDKQERAAHEAAQMFQGPILIVDANDDQVFTAEERAELERLYPHAKRAAVDGMGHAATLDKIEDYIEIYEQSLRRDRVDQ